MRRFSSYGPINNNHDYYAPREELIEQITNELVGQPPEENGHYLTVWAPRQTGKTWIMREILFRLKKDPRFRIIKINLENLKQETNTEIIINHIAEEIGKELNTPLTGINSPLEFSKIFSNETLDKPLILILDEFDALSEKGINTIVSVFRNIYMSRKDEKDKTTDQKKYLLHGVALIGVRSVLGVENVKGSPFNVQKSVHIPQLTYDEVNGMFQWYQKESGQSIDQSVIDRIYYEFNGQPGLTCWFGELLTETYNTNKKAPITMEEFKYAYMYASAGLPNNNTLNLIEKARKEPYKDIVLNLFQTDEKLAFSFDDQELNYLYTNGIIDIEENPENGSFNAKFASPFIQERLFNNFSRMIFEKLGRITDPFENLDNVITETHLNIPGIVSLYQEYLKKNKDTLFKDVPRRKDLRIYEAVYHFNFYRFLYDFFRGWKTRVHPEFPTGNGKIDLLIDHYGALYGIELKSFSNQRIYAEALKQTAAYARKIGVPEMHLVFFIESIDDANRVKFETPYISSDENTPITIKPLFIQTQ